MHPEIENLINMALADDEVTEKERSIILRKAESLGLDKDEVEMILDGKIALMIKEKKASQNQSKTKSNKEGDIKKCPSCGAPAQSFATKCPDCGHEFRGTSSSASMTNIFEEIKKVEQTIGTQEMELSKLEKGGFWDAKKTTPVYVLREKIATIKASIITNFPVPNTKEDILEFLSLAVPQAKMNAGPRFDFWGEHKGKKILKAAWMSKCEQVIMKACFSLKDDKKTLDEVDFFAKQLKIK